jgi:negative regulator of flagellin synthesis FlgM
MCRENIHVKAKGWAVLADSLLESKERMFAVKITNRGIQINKVYQQVEKKEIKQEKSPAEKSDSLTISAGANKVAEAVKLVQELDDVRLERVEELRQAIAEGKYQVDSRKLAEAMLPDKE